MRRRVWITGFEPFDGADCNISAEIAMHLVDQGASHMPCPSSGRNPSVSESPLTIQWSGEVLTVDSEGARRTAESLPKDIDAIIHLGLKVGGESVLVERSAVNGFAFRIPDESGRMVTSGIIIEDAPKRLMTTANLSEIEMWVSEDRLVEMSDDCGGFVCNETYFRTLEAVTRDRGLDLNKSRTPVLFIHLPPDSVSGKSEIIRIIERIASLVLQDNSVRVVAAVIERCGRILCCQRSAQDSMPLAWEFPGGKVERGESDEEALVREIIEELGAVVQPIERFGVTVHESGSVRYVIHFWSCEIVSGEPRAKVHEEIRWTARMEMLELDWLPADMNTVARIAHSSSV